MRATILATILVVIATSQLTYADSWILWHKFTLIDKTKPVDQQTQDQEWQQLDVFETKQACQNELESALRSMKREATKDEWHVDISRGEASIVYVYGRNHEDIGQATELMSGGIACRPPDKPLPRR